PLPPGASAKWVLSGIESAADNAAKVLAAARAAGDLVVHVRHEFPTADAPFFAPRSDGARIHPKVKNLEGEPVVLKHHVDAFREPALKGILDRHGIAEVGTGMHFCPFHHRGRERKARESNPHDLSVARLSRAARQPVNAGAGLNLCSRSNWPSAT